MTTPQVLNQTPKLKIETVEIKVLNPAPYNPRKWSDEAIAQLTKSIKRFGLVDPAIVNGAPNRRNVVIGGHMRIKCAKNLGLSEIPVVYVNIPDESKEKELNLLLNRAVGEWDWSLLAEFDESLLASVGFTSEEIDTIFDLDETVPEEFNLGEELKKLNIQKIEAQKGDIYALGDSRLMVGDSTIEADVLKLMDGQLADMENLFSSSGFSDIHSRGIACITQPQAEDFDPENKHLGSLSAKINASKIFFDTLLELELKASQDSDAVDRGMNIMTIGSKNA